MEQSILGQPVIGWIVLFSIIVGLIWLSVLSVMLSRANAHARALFGNTSKDDLKDILHEHINRVGAVQIKMKEVDKMMVELHNNGLRHLSKVGVVRFNPFEDTGGDQSFTLALLDDKNDGVVLSSLHGRQRTRVYAKPVRGGEAEEYEFSHEEKEAIRKACTVGSK